MPQSKVEELSAFPASTHASANQVVATQLELANEVVHGVVIISKHAALFAARQYKVWQNIAGMGVKSYLPTIGMGDCES